MALDERLTGAGSKIRRHIPERRDAQTLRRELELRMAVDGVGHGPGETDVFRDRLTIRSSANLSEREPYLERAETAGVLRTVVDVVRRELLEVIVRRVVRERCSQRFRIAHE